MIPFPTKKYSIIYADPPWSYEFGKTSSRFVGKQYDLMTLNKICDLDVGSISEKDCLLLLWVTFPKLEECFKVIKSWGFTYKTILFNWIKTYKNGNLFMGLGNYTHANAEVLLLSRRGNGFKILNRGINSILISPYTGHSKKPKIVRQKIVELFGDLPRIELFARKPKDVLFEDESFKGWDVWGNEC